jgi:hypothetical protein
MGSRQLRAAFPCLLFVHRPEATAAHPELHQIFYPAEGKFDAVRGC